MQAKKYVFRFLLCFIAALGRWRASLFLFGKFWCCGRKKALFAFLVCTTFLPFSYFNRNSIDFSPPENRFADNCDVHDGATDDKEREREREGKHNVNNLNTLFAQVICLSGGRMKLCCLRARVYANKQTPSFASGQNGMGEKGKNHRIHFGHFFHSSIYQSYVIRM